MPNPYRHGATAALLSLGLTKSASADRIDFQQSLDQGMTLNNPGLRAPANAPALVPASGPSAPMKSVRRPGMKGLLGLGAAVGLGMGAHAMATGRNLAPKPPQLVYNYAGPANPLL